VSKQDLATFEKYLANFWMILQIEQDRLLAELARERNNDLISSFASDYALRFIIIQKTKDDEIRVENEWLPEMLSSTNILLIKKNTFNIYKDITAFKVAEMLQVHADPLRSSTSTSPTNPTPSTSPSTISTN
jgi:hypothetical protein